MGATTSMRGEWRRAARQGKDTTMTSINGAQGRRLPRNGFRGMFLVLCVTLGLVGLTLSGCEFCSGDTAHPGECAEFPD
jgi:hypothetical protein